MATLVTGGNGFLGSTLVRKLNQLNPKEIVTPSSKDFDLRFKDNCETITKNIDIVFFDIINLHKTIWRLSTEPYVSVFIFRY